MSIQEQVYSAAESVKTTVAPVLSKGIEKVIETIEKLDTKSVEREHIYGAASDPQNSAANQDKVEEIKVDDGDIVEVKDAGDVQNQQVVAVEGAGSEMSKLKLVTGDLIDLWLYQGNKGLQLLKQSKAYQLTDPYMHYIETYDAMKQNGVKLFEKI